MNTLPHIAIARLRVGRALLGVTAAIAAVTGCAPHALSQNGTTVAMASVTISPGTFDYALPRAICYPGARVGDTVTTLLTRPISVLDRGLYYVVRDTTVPADLKAFLRVSRVGAATKRNVFRVDFDVDSFAFGAGRGHVAVTGLLPDPERVHSTLLADRSFVDCYGAQLRGVTKSALVLRPR